jgi:hypothetical protein
MSCLLSPPTEEGYPTIRGRGFDALTSSFRFLSSRPCSNPRVGVSRPVPNGTLPLLSSSGCREALALSFRLSPETPGTKSQESLSGGRDSGHRGLEPLASAMASGAPQRRASVGGAGSAATA